MSDSNDNRIYLFDTTLRDGAQTQGVDFTVADKVAIEQGQTTMAPGAPEPLATQAVHSSWP